MKNLLQKGFTFIELMITVAIIGIAAAIGLPVYDKYVKNQQAAATGTDANLLDARTSKTYGAAVHTSTKVVVVNDQDFETITDFKTGQLCLSRRSSQSDLLCRDFENATEGQKKLIAENRTLLQDPKALLSNGDKPSRRDSITYEVNTAALTVTEYDSEFARRADFRQETLCVTKPTSSSAGLSCKDFSALNDTQRAYVGDLHKRLNAIRTLAPAKS